MVPLRLVWTLLVVSSWTFGSSQFLLHKPVKVLYPAVLSSETIDCDCRNISCNIVLWFYMDPVNAKVRYIGRCNNAERTVFGDDKDNDRFKLTKRGSSTFVLRIMEVTRKDAGIYSCVVRDTRSQAEMYNPGTSLRPGAASEWTVSGGDSVTFDSWAELWMATPGTCCHDDGMRICWVPVGQAC